MPIDQDLAANGVPARLASELIRAMAGTPTTAVRLTALGVPAPLAVELATQANGGTKNVNALMALGFPAGAAIALGAGGTGPLLRFVTSINELNENSIGSAATSGNALHKSRRKMYVAAPVKANTLRGLNRTIAHTTGGAQVVGGAFATKVSFELAGTVYSAAQITIPSASPEMLTDAITHPAIAAATQIWGRRVREYAVGDIPLYRHSTTADSPAITGNSYLRGAPGSSTDDGVAGDLVATGFASLPGAAMTSFVGEPSAPGLFFFCAGASGEFGTSSTVSDTPGDGENGAGGYVRRGFANHSTKYPLAIDALAGQSAADYAVDLANSRRVYKYANRFILGHLGNDFSSGLAAAGGTWTDAQAVASAEAAWNNSILPVIAAILAESPGAYIAQMDMSPKAGGNYTSDAGQTVLAGFIAYRARIRELAAIAIANGTLRAVLSTASVDESATKPGAWANDAGVGRTTDGTHRTPAAHGTAGTALMAQLGAPFMGASMLANPTL